MEDQKVKNQRNFNKKQTVSGEAISRDKQVTNQLINQGETGELNTKKIELGKSGSNTFEATKAQN